MSPFIRASLSAEEAAEILRGNARRLDDALWALESARSMLRKAQAGYRNAAGTGDGVWDLDTYQRRLEAATLAAGRLINELKLEPIGCEVPLYQRTVDASLADQRGARALIT